MLHGLPNTDDVNFPVSGTFWPTLVAMRPRSQVDDWFDFHY